MSILKSPDALLGNVAELLWSDSAFQGMGKDSFTSVCPYSPSPRPLEALTVWNSAFILRAVSKDDSRCSSVVGKKGVDILGGGWQMETHNWDVMDTEKTSSSVAH
jgi:hypothetical protein